MKTIRYFLLTLFVLAPGLASAQTADSLDLVIGGVVYPAIAPSWTLNLEEGETYGPFSMSVAEPDIACIEDEGAGIPTITNPEEVEGTIVIIARGACNFTTKVTAAFNAGAAGVILWSATTEATPDAFPAIGGDPSETTQLRVAFVSYNTGLAALEAAEFGEEATFIQTYTVPEPVDLPNVTIDNGTIQTSLYVNGFFGAEPTINFGEGFVFDGTQGLYVGSFLIGVADGDTTVTTNPYDGESEFTSVTDPVLLDAANVPAPFDVGARTVFTSPLGFEVTLTGYADNDAPNQGFVIYDAAVTNTSGAAMDDVYLGIFADWDIGATSVDDDGAVDESLNLVYVFDPVEAAPYFGVAAIGESLSGYNTTGGAGAGGASDEELFGSMTAAIDTAAAAQEQSTVLGVGPIDFAVGETVTRRFAFVAGADLAELQANAAAAQNLTVAVEETTPEGTFVLESAYPNPFAQRTVIGFELPTAQDVRLTVYDVLGREVATLVDGVRQAGPQTVEFDASSLPSGMYIYRLEAGSTQLTQRVTLVR